MATVEKKSNLSVLKTRMENYLAWEKEQYEKDDEDQTPDEFAESQKRKMNAFNECPEDFADYLDDSWDSL